MSSYVHAEIDGTVIPIPLREWNKLITQAKRAILPTESAAGKSLAWAMRAAVRDWRQRQAPTAPGLF